MFNHLNKLQKFANDVEYHHLGLKLVSLAFKIIKLKVRSFSHLQPKIMLTTKVKVPYPNDFFNFQTNPIDLLSFLAFSPLRWC